MATKTKTVGQMLCDIKAEMGETIRAEMSTGRQVVGQLAYHPLAGWCVLNQFGVPASIEKAKSVVKAPT